MLFFLQETGLVLFTAIDQLILRRHLNAAGEFLFYSPHVPFDCGVRNSDRLLVPIVEIFTPVTIFLSSSHLFYKVFFDMMFFSQGLQSNLR